MLKLTFPFAIRASWRNLDEVMAARGPWRRVEYDAVSAFRRLTATETIKIMVGLENTSFVICEMAQGQSSAAYQR